jgi:serine/threonine protein kinase
MRLLLLLVLCFLANATLRENKERLRKTLTHHQTDEISMFKEDVRKMFAKLGVKVLTDGFPAGITLGAKLGEGTYGKVYEGTMDDGSGKVAVKVVRPQGGQSVQALKTSMEEEMDRLIALADCPHVMKVTAGFFCRKNQLPMAIRGDFGAIGDTDIVVGMINEIIAGGNLAEKWLLLSDPQRYNLMIEYSKGFKCINTKGYAHADVKPLNLMITWAGPDAGAEPKGVIIDVGLMRKLDAATQQCKDGGYSYYRYYKYSPRDITDATNCDNAIAHFDEYGLGQAFAETGASDAAGTKAKALRDTMKTIPDNTTPRWDTFIGDFTLGKNAGANADWALLTPGGGYTKPA